VSILILRFHPFDCIGRVQDGEKRNISVFQWPIRIRHRKYGSHGKSARLETVVQLSGNKKHFRVDKIEKRQVCSFAIPGNHKSAGENVVRYNIVVGV